MILCSGNPPHPVLCRPRALREPPRRRNAALKWLQGDHDLPKYRIERPPQELIRVLGIIQATSHKFGYVSKKMLISKLKKAGISCITGPAKHENIARYRALER